MIRLVGLLKRDEGRESRDDVVQGLQTREQDDELGEDDGMEIEVI